MHKSITPKRPEARVMVVRIDFLGQLGVIVGQIGGGTAWGEEVGGI